MRAIFNSRFLQFTIGLMGIIVSSATMGIPYTLQTKVLAIVRALELTASGLLIFGLVKKRDLHKSKIMMVWLICTLLFVAGLFYNMFEGFWMFHRISVATSIIVTASLLGAAAVLSGMMYVVYSGYERLVDGTDEQILTA
ncbi:uncharacterized protein LOC117188501 [Drosophila miranda]|uniref:uncharacterized protein LOC117188501 n=1 Tax=Drosophila miranda TaxID=7229 RepID=UPI0007E845C8|nr:uncharacterized protein LOC117188501 [Drosophila miranda]